MVTPRIERTLSVLEILFERYSPSPTSAPSELGGDGPDGNFGGCAHCVPIPGDRRTPTLPTAARS